MAQLQIIAANNKDAERSLADLKIEVSIVASPNAKCEFFNLRF